MPLGRVARSSRDYYTVLLDDDEREVRLAGSLRHRATSAADLPVTGDWVQVREGVVEAVLPRKTRISRRAAGTREQEQVLAANVDLVLIVCGLDGDYNPRRIERYLVVARESGARAGVVLNKSDLCFEVEERLEEIGAIAGGVPVIAASTRSPGGLEGVESLLDPGSTVVLLGSSGAGKSSILNALSRNARQATGEVRAADSRGRHTTTARELFRLDCGAWAIDTPGLRELQLWASEEAVEETFEDVAALASECRFRDCSHGEEPGCAVRSALAEGRLEVRRWEAYRKLAAEVRRHAVLKDERTRLEQKRELKRLHKDMRRHYKQKP